jgi:hypothetical protein
MRPDIKFVQPQPQARNDADIDTAARTSLIAPGGLITKNICEITETTETVLQPQQDRSETELRLSETEPRPAETDLSQARRALAPKSPRHFRNFNHTRSKLSAISTVPLCSALFRQKISREHLALFSFKTPTRALGPRHASQICKTLYLPVTMKTLLLLAVVLIAVSLNAVAADSGNGKNKRPGNVKHMVAFKFKDGTSQADIDKLNAAFADLENKIDVIRTFDTGKNNSPENLNKGTTHGYLLTFDSEADRDTYLNHPAHKEFGSMAGKILADVFVFDFTSGHAKGKDKDKSEKKAEKAEKSKDKNKDK